MLKYTSLLFLIGTLFSAHSQATVVWAFQTEGRVYSSPILFDQILYVGSGDNNFYAIDQASGKQVWKFETEGSVHSSPALNNELVIFGNNEGKLFALDRITGTLKWSFSSKGEKQYGLWDYYLSSPLIDSEKIYWGSGDGSVYALDVKTGNIIWEFETGDLVHASPKVDGLDLVIGSFDGNLYSLNKENGILNWKFKTLGAEYFPKGEIQKAVSIDEETIYFGSRDYNLYALDKKTGACKWNYREPEGWIISTPLVLGDKIYFGTSDAHKFYCLNRVSGEILWETPLKMRVYGKAVAYNELIYFGTFDGWVYGLNPENGDIKWEFQTEMSKKNSSTVFNEEGGFKEGFQLYGEDYLESEKKIHDLGSILGTPLIIDGVIYFGSSDGKIYAVNL